MTNAMKKYDTILSKIEEMCRRIDAVDASFKITQIRSDALGEVNKNIPKLASLEEAAQLKERVNALSIKCQTYGPYAEFSRLREENSMVVLPVSFLEKGSSFKWALSGDSSVHSTTASDGSKWFKCKRYAVVWRVFVRKLIRNLAKIFLCGALNFFHMSLMLFPLFQQQLEDINGKRSSADDAKREVYGCLGGESGAQDSEDDETSHPLQGA